MMRYFSSYGEVKNVEILKDKNTGKSRCFGFVEFQESETVAQVMNSDHIINNKKIECKYALPSSLAPPSKRRQRREWNPCRIFVGGLSQCISEVSLRKYFQQFGEIEDCVILKHEGTRKYRGFAFVTYGDYKSTEKLFLGGRFHFINGKKVDCKYAFPKKDKFDGLDEMRKKKMEDAVSVVQVKAQAKDYMLAFPRLASPNCFAGDDNNKFETGNKFQKKNIGENNIANFSSDEALKKIVSFLDEDEVGTEPSLMEQISSPLGEKGAKGQPSFSRGSTMPIQTSNRSPQLEKKSSNFLLSNIFSKSDDEIVDAKSPISKQTDLRCAKSGVFSFTSSVVSTFRRNDNQGVNFLFDEPIPRTMVSSSLSEKVSPSKSKDDGRERLGSINFLNDRNCLKATNSTYRAKIQSLARNLVPKENNCGDKLGSKQGNKDCSNYLMKLKRAKTNPSSGGFSLFG